LILSVRSSGDNILQKARQNHDDCTGLARHICLLMLAITDALKGRNIEDVSEVVKHFLEDLTKYMLHIILTDYLLTNGLPRTLTDIDSDLRALKLKPTFCSLLRNLFRRQYIADKISSYKSQVENSLRRFQV
jgi:hypothetical protein